MGPQADRRKAREARTPEDPHSPPLRFTGRYPADANTPVFHRRSAERGGLSTLVILGGLIGGESSAARYSRGIERGDSRLAPLVGRIGGWVGSGRFAERFSARWISRRPFVFLCEYHGFNIPDGHATAALVGLDSGGPIRAYAGHSTREQVSADARGRKGVEVSARAGARRD